MPREASLSLTSLLALSRDIAEVYKQKKRPPSVITELQALTQELSVVIEQVKQNCPSDFPDELLVLITDIRADLEQCRSRLLSWQEKQQLPSTRWLIYIPVIKPLLVSLAPVGALYVSMSQYGLYALVSFLALFAVFLVILRQFPKVLEDLHDSWDDADVKRFKLMKDKLEKHMERVKRFQALQMQLQERNRFDVSKILSGEEKDFWINNFGAENHSVETNRFIETLLHIADEGGPQKYKEENRKLVYRILGGLVDSNQDGSVSPQEFSNFLEFFGPLNVCCPKSIGSLINLDVKPARPNPWFTWHSMDRQDVELGLATSPPGTFTIRCSSRPGTFAIDYSTVSDQQLKIHHSIIRNDLEKGYHFQGSETYFPTLRHLVEANLHILQTPYMDPSQSVSINVGGKLFKCNAGLFFRFPNTRLGRMFSSGERFLENQVTFFDRDPDSFNVILNWYRYGKVVVPSNVPAELVQEDLKFFEINPYLHAVVSDFAIYDERPFFLFSQDPNPGPANLQPQDGSLLEFERYKSFFPSISREQAAQLLHDKPLGTCILRGCSQKDEYVEGKPNTNLLVITYTDIDAERQSMKLVNVKAYRHPTGFGLSKDPSSAVYSSVRALVAGVVGPSARLIHD